MIIIQKAISRRTVLRGIGTTLALPLLDAMVPAFAATTAKPRIRLGYVYVPVGRIMDKWTPAAVGSSFEMTHQAQTFVRGLVPEGRNVVDELIAERREETRKEEPDEPICAAFVDAVEAGARSAQAGNLHPNEEAMEILEFFGE